MWTPDEIVQVLAEAYHAAALANADMRNATEALEAIRSALLGGQDTFRIWNLIDLQIGRAEVDRLQSVLIKLRNRFEQRFLESEIARLHEVFRQDPSAGWTEWLRTYAEALSYWRLPVYFALIKEAFTFEPPADKDAEKIRQWTKFVSHGRWPEVHDLFIYLNRQTVIPNVQRAKFLVAAGEIQLYHFTNPDKAKEFFHQAKNLAPNEPRVAQGWGEYWLKKNEIEKAIDYFQRAVELDPQFVGGYIGMGDCFENQGDFDAAEEWYQAAIKHASGYETGYERLFSLYGKPSLFPKNKERILPLVKRAIVVTDDVYYLYLQVGYVYKQNKEYEEAHKWIDKAIELDVDRLEGYYQKGYVYFEEAKYDQASIFFQKSIDVAPEACDGYWGMSLVHEALKQWKEALHWYEKILERRPDLEEPIRERIDNVEWELGKHDSVIARLIDALKSKPENEVLTNRLHRLARRFYQELNNFPAALHVYSEMRKIKGDAYEGEHQNLVGNLKYYDGQYEEAKEAYLKAVRANPDTAVYHANLADAWTNLQVPGRRIEAINRALSALERASELDPEDVSYGERLERLQRRKSIITYFGESTLDMPMPVVTPIVVEFASDLIPHVEGKEESGMSPKLTTFTSNMREHILRDLGVKIPGIRFRGNTDLQNGTYVIMLMESPVVKEQIAQGKRLLPGSSRKLISLKIDADQTVNPQTGDEAYWIGEQDWERVESAKLELWDVIEYPIRHLEAVIRKNLSDFVGHQEVMNLLEASSNDACIRIQNSKEHLTALVQVLKALISEEVPITAFEPICEEFEYLYDAGTDPTTTAERLRSISEIRGKLSGNNNQFSFYQLGQRFEEQIHQSIHTEDHLSVLVMEPEDCQNILTAVRENVGSQTRVALLVENAELRPFVHKLIELEFPHIPVLSRQELLPELEWKIVGEIEVTGSQNIIGTEKPAGNFLEER